MCVFMYISELEKGGTVFNYRLTERWRFQEKMDTKKMHIGDYCNLGQCIQLYCSLTMYHFPTTMDWRPVCISIKGFVSLKRKP